MIKKYKKVIDNETLCRYNVNKNETQEGIRNEDAKTQTLCETKGSIEEKGS